MSQGIFELPIITIIYDKLEHFRGKQLCQFHFHFLFENQSSQKICSPEEKVYPTPQYSLENFGKYMIKVIFMTLTCH